MIILCLDSSGHFLKTGIFDNGERLSEAVSDSRGNHSEKIILQIARMLDEAGKKLDDIGLLAINLGPGSFTGLRIGLAAVAGFSQAKAIPLIGCNAFEIIARDIPALNGNIWGLIHCRGEEFYCARYEGSNKRVRLVGDYSILNPRKLELSKSETILVGSGATRFHGLLDNDQKQHYGVAKNMIDIPNLNSLAELAREKAAGQKFTGGYIPELFYLSPSQAEVNYARKNDNRG
jgi:tRNA threonylcarbamoyl adenosine modification protein YeaZ